MRVAAYTGGVMVPSARARVRQYIHPLAKLGIRGARIPAALGQHTAPATQPSTTVDGGDSGGTHGRSHLLLECRCNLALAPASFPRLPPFKLWRAADDPRRR